VKHKTRLVPNILSLKVVLAALNWSKHKGVNAPELISPFYRYFNALKTKINLNYIYNFYSVPYRAVNTPRLGYKNQSVNAV